MNKNILTAALVTALAAHAAAAPNWPIKGQDSALITKQTLVISDPAAWTGLWKSIDKEGRPAPEVDFASEMIVGEFSGDESYVLNKVAKDAAAKNGQASPKDAAKLNEFKGRLAALTSSIQAGIGASAGDDFTAVPRFSTQQGKPLPGQGEDKDDNHRRGGQEPGKPLPGKPLPGGDQGKPLPGGDHGKPLPGGDRGKPLPGGDQGKPLPGSDRYHSRPDRYHEGRRPPREVPYDDNRVDSAGYWRPERDFMGYSVVSYGNWQQTTGRASIERGGRETGLGQGTGFQAQLKSTSYRSVYRLYWRWIGRDCDPNDHSRCADWDTQHRWFLEGTDEGRTSFMTVNVSFRGDLPLLPWERENFGINYDGGRISVSVGSAGYDYAVDGPFIDQQNGTASVTLSPLNKRLNAPEAGKVGLYLVNEGGSLKLVSDDARTSFYSGEPLEIAVQIKKDSGHWYKKDAVIMEREQNGPIRIVVQGGVVKQTVAAVPTNGGGKYYIKSWSFRRAESKISGGGWIYKGEGNSVQF